MAKVMKTITIDSEVMDLAKSKNTNVSGLCNDFLKSYLASNDNLSDKNITYLKAKHSKLQKEFTIIKAEMDKINVTIEEYENKREERKLLKLKEEKDEEDRKSKCEVCGTKIENPIELKGVEHFKCINCLHGD